MKPLSDVQSEKSNLFESLSWVGMTNLQTAIQVPYADSQILTVPALVNLGVNLKENHRGIHMSRLYQILQNSFLQKKLDQDLLNQMADQSLSSQEGLSQDFSVQIKFDFPKETRALVSELKGYRNYPVCITFEKQSDPTNPQQAKSATWVNLEILYSSTCPQSAGLSHEVHKQQKNPSENFWQATPHAQRSRAILQVMLSDFNLMWIDSLINDTEKTLGTPVQTTVKKQDEMRFAELNAANLMFCEDAVRKIYRLLKSKSEVRGFKISCIHEESLHPHNATSVGLWNYREPMTLPIK